MAFCFGEGGVPGDLLFAFAVAADPFELAVFFPVGRDFCGGGKFDRGVGGSREELFECGEVWFVVVEGGGSIAGRAAVGVDVPGGDGGQVERCDVL